MLDPRPCCGTTPDCHHLETCPKHAEPPPTLVRKSLANIVAFWRPGSHDWAWADEYADLIDKPPTEAVRQRVLGEGVGFVDHLAPVLLGSDGRVWDGHHRIVIALEFDLPWLMVEMAATAPTPASRRDADHPEAKEASDQ